MNELKIEPPDPIRPGTTCYFHGREPVRVEAMTDELWPLVVAVKTVETKTAAEIEAMIENLFVSLP